MKVAKRLAALVLVLALGAAVAGCAAESARVERDGSVIGTTQENLAEYKESARVQRYGSVIGIKQENLAEYKRLHAAVWPEILAKLRDVHVRNYSIYLAEVRPGEYYLFSYFEYTGGDFKADMARMAADPDTKRWWTHTDPLQMPVPTRKEGEWWHTLEEVFHMD